MKFGIGQSVVRREDDRFLRGQGQYIEDIVDPHALHVAFTRSPVAHARLTGVDTRAARDVPGVVAVLIGDDYSADGIGGLTCHTVLPGMHQTNAITPAPAIATDRLRYVGAPAAMVIAENARAARDAA